LRKANNLRDKCIRLRRAGRDNFGRARNEVGAIAYVPDSAPHDSLMCQERQKLVCFQRSKYGFPAFLAILGLAVETCSLLGFHPLSFVAFALVSGLLIVAGIAVS
jgi:hypothetical protein